MKFNMGENICIDAGSEYTSIYISGKGLVLREHSAICRRINTGKIIAVGDEASSAEERLPKTLKIIRPIQNGVICDIKAAKDLLSLLINKVRSNKLIKPRIMISVPGEITEVEGRAVVDTVMQAGARQVIIVPAPVVSALGAGCDVTIARGLMTLDIGAEKTEMAAISLCHPVISKTLKMGANSFTEDLKVFLRKKYNLETGTHTAEKAKITLGALSPVPAKTIDICGADISTHLPRKITVSTTDISDIYEERLDKIAKLIKESLDEIPPELAGDILSDGILLVGGGAKLDGIADKLRIKSGIKIYTAENPELCNIKGTGLAFEHIDELPDIVQSYHNL